ncbi:hypothetical protein Dimus_019038 [Dionaea muscipula]
MITCKRVLSFDLKTQPTNHELTIAEVLPSLNTHNNSEKIIIENLPDRQPQNVDGVHLKFNFGSEDLSLNDRQKTEQQIMVSGATCAKISNHANNQVDHGSLQAYCRTLEPHFPRSFSRRRKWRRRTSRSCQNLKDTSLWCKLVELYSWLDEAELRMLIPKGMRSYIINNQKVFLCPLTLCNSLLVGSKKKRSWTCVKGHNKTLLRMNSAMEKVEVEQDLHFESRNHLEIFMNKTVDNKQQNGQYAQTIMEDLNMDLNKINGCKEEGTEKVSAVQDLHFESKNCSEIFVHEVVDNKQQNGQDAQARMKHLNMDLNKTNGCKEEGKEKVSTVQDLHFESKNCSEIFMEEVVDNKQHNGQDAHTRIEDLNANLNKTNGCKGGKDGDKQMKGKKKKQMKKHLALTPVECKDFGDIGNGPSDASAKGFIQNDMLAIVPYAKQSSKYEPKVYLDPLSERMWELSIGNYIGDTSEEEEILKEEKIFHERIHAFIAMMHLMQGDRRFSQWKGSVLDSVIGAFLTPNVSDKLSSNAFLSLAAHFPLQSTSNLEAEESEANMDDTSSEAVESTNNKTCRSQSDTGNKQAKDTVEDLIPANTLTNPENIVNIFSLQENVDTSLNKCIEESSCNFCLQEEERPLDSSLKALESDKMEEKGRPKVDPKLNKGKGKKNQDKGIDGHALWAKYAEGRQGKRSQRSLDSIDWNSVRGASLQEIAAVISQRGMHNQIAKRIKDFLNKIVETHGDLDLEWLRSVPPDEAKEYLLSFDGLGLKSVECIRLLSLHHRAFPVDTNVGRVVVRLGWVPLKPLPEGEEFHLLQQYPIMDHIQKYLWPRLSKLNQETLYQLHYQMITFGKVFCTKRNPNCNACPMRKECKHFASASTRLKYALPGPWKKQTTTSMAPTAEIEKPYALKSSFLPCLTSNAFPKMQYERSSFEPIIEEPPSPEPEQEECEDSTLIDIEDLGQLKDLNEIPLIQLNAYWPTEKTPFQDKDQSKALVELSPEAASVPLPKQKEVGRLKTEHQVYELPDNHPLLEKMQADKREPDDPGRYLFVIWTTDKHGISNNNEEETSLLVPGTLLIPCRTATRGRFPLNATYFQVNEVFADDETMICPVNVPRNWLGKLEKRTLYCGVTTSSLFRGLSSEEIHKCFWQGTQYSIVGTNRMYGIHITNQINRQGKSRSYT